MILYLYKRFYLKTFWSLEGMGSVILNTDINPTSAKVKKEEYRGIPCIFDLLVSNKGTWIRPVYQVLLLCIDRERMYHSYVGESTIGVRATKILFHFFYHI